MRSAISSSPGLESIAKSLAHVKELRLLIGNTTNRETLEQLAEGYRRLELVSEKAEEQAFPKRTEMKRMAEETANNIRSTVELMDQSDDAQALLTMLVRLIEEKRLKVRVYTKGRLHAKAYIFDYADMFDVLGNKVERHENGIAIIGSSNLTLAGVSHNTELNVCVQGNDNHAELGRWFDELWNESQDFDEALMREMQQSWAVAPLTPYDIYMKTLYALVKDRLEDEDDQTFCGMTTSRGSWRTFRKSPSGRRCRSQETSAGRLWRTWWAWARATSAQPS